MAKIERAILSCYDKTGIVDLARVLRELIDHPETRPFFQANVRPGPTMQQHAERMLLIYQALSEGKPLRQTTPQVS